MAATLTGTALSPTAISSDDSHTSVPNELADTFVVSLTLYTLLSSIFGVSHICHEDELLRDQQRVRWWYYVGLFMLGWAWPVFCCFLIRDLVVDWSLGRQRRRSDGETALGR